jgi:hypothetical protein
MSIRFTQRIGRSVGIRITRRQDESVMPLTQHLRHRDERTPQPLAHTLKFRLRDTRGRPYEEGTSRPNDSFELV